MPFSSLVRTTFESGLCHFRAWFVPLSSLVCAIFEPGSCHFRAWSVPFSSLVRAIFKPALYPIRAWFVPFSSLVGAIFEPALYPFRAWFMPFARLRCSCLTSFAEGSEKGTRGEGNKEASLEATCKFMPISSLSGSGIHVGSNWLEQQTVEKTAAHCCSSVPPSAKSSM